MRVTLFLSAVLLASSIIIPAASAGPTVDAVRERGFLRCGVKGDLAGFSTIDETGQWAGLDVDFCRATAAAVLGDRDRVEYISLSASARFPALLGDEIDVLIRNTTWTYGRDAALGLEFVAVTFYDGQGFMARTSLGASSLQELGPDIRVCFETSTTTALNLSDYAVNHDMRYEPVAFESASESRMALFSGRCDLYTTDRSALVAIRGAHVPNPEDYVILSDVISKEPLGPVVRDDDPQWREIVQWVVFATIEAEERGITSANVTERRNSSADPAVAAMLGRTAGIGKGLGLDDEWVYRVIRQVGNYGEIFARNLGADSPLTMDRGLNALWTEGGLMYSPPLR